MNFATGNNYSLLAGDDIYGPNNIYAYILDYCHNKKVSFSPNVTIINIFFLRDFHYLKLKFNYLYSKKSLLSKLNRLNIFSAPGAHINFELVNKEEYFKFLIDFEGDVYEDYPSWKYFFLIKKYSVNFYHTEVIFYRPKFTIISENYLKLHYMIKIKFMISNLLFYIIYYLRLDSLIGMYFNNINELKSFYYDLVRRAKIFY
jgi:hypothetical protein